MTLHCNHADSYALSFVARASKTRQSSIFSKSLRYPQHSSR